MVDKKHLESAVVPKQEYDDMVAAYQKKIRELQKLAAKKQVNHESEIEKMRVEFMEMGKPVFNMQFVSPDNKKS